MSLLTTVTQQASIKRTASADDRKAAQAHVIAKVEISLDRAAVLGDWAELEAIAAASAYQRRSFMVPWIDTIGESRQIQPLFILGKDFAGQVVALLCLGLERAGPIRIAHFLGGKDSNFNLGLFRPNVGLSKADLRFLLRDAARALGQDAPHLFILANQPFAWSGIDNPFALLPHQLSPSFSYKTDLKADGADLVGAKLSKAARKKLRKKDQALEKFGPIEVITNDTAAAAHTIIDAFLYEKIARCEARALNADFVEPAMRRFLERLSMPRDGRAPWLEFYALKAGSRIIATYAGAEHHNHFSCIFNSFDSDPEIAKVSPGNLLLKRLMAIQCEKRRDSLDLGIGEARYKASFCDIPVPLFDAIVPVDALGFVYGVYMGLRLRIKRMVKQTPALYAAFLALRQRLRPAAS